jgi:hypothetical protein
MFRTSLQQVKQADDSDDSDDEEEAQHFQKLINEAEEKKRLLQEAHDKAVGKQTLKRKRTVFDTKITKKAKYMDEYEHRGLKKTAKKQPEQEEESTDDSADIDGGTSFVSKFTFGLL